MCYMGLLCGRWFESNWPQFFRPLIWIELVLVGLLICTFYPYVIPIIIFYHFSKTTIRGSPQHVNALGRPRRDVTPEICQFSY